MKIQIYNVRSDSYGYSQLAQIYATLKDCEWELIEIDWSACGWFDANMCAPLGVVMAHIMNNFNNIQMTGIRGEVETILAKNGFLGNFGYTTRKDTYGSTIPYRCMQPNDDRYFITYVDQHLKRQEIPSMSSGLTQRFQDSLLEIFSNAAFHSETQRGIFTCGQYFHKTNRLDFSLADAGIGLRWKIKKERNLDMTAIDAIKWALQEGNTTRKGKIPGGLGLKLLKDFATMNKGRLQIVSDQGYWELSRVSVNMPQGGVGGEMKESFSSLLFPFPGTIVNLEINTSDPKSYCLPEEINS